MEVKNSIFFEIEKEERTYRFEMPGGAPLGEVYECAGMFLDKVVELINEHADKKKAQESVEESSTEEASEE